MNISYKKYNSLTGKDFIEELKTYNIVSYNSLIGNSFSSVKDISYLSKNIVDIFICRKYSFLSVSFTIENHEDFNIQFWYTKKHYCYLYIEFLHSVLSDLKFSNPSRNDLKEIFKEVEEYFSEQNKPLTKK